MLYRYRYIILSGLVTAAVVLVCLFAPDFFLTLERHSDAGRVMHGENVYNADDISDASISTFNFQKRLMMLSGQWKCEKELVELVDNVLDRESLERICISIPALLMQDLNAIASNNDLFYNWIGDEIDYAVDRYWQHLDAALGEDTRSGNERSPYPNIPDNVNLSYAALFYGGHTKLYKYTDSILSGYYFYVWDYSVEDEDLGVSYDIKVDAVTLDIYSFAIHGSRLDVSGWYDLFMLYPGWVDAYGNESGVVTQARDLLPFGMPDISVNMLVLSYGSYLYTDYMANNISGVRAFKSDSQGYSYTMNFLQRSDMEAQMIAEGILKMTSGNETVYACIRSGSGFEFYFTSEAPENFDE